MAVPNFEIVGSVGIVLYGVLFLHSGYQVLLHRQIGQNQKYSEYKLLFHTLFCAYSLLETIYAITLLAYGKYAVCTVESRCLDWFILVIHSGDIVYTY
jgi:hypothetical protein